MPTHFMIPIYSHQSTYGARTAYEEGFGRIWPFDDAYLRELAREINPHSPRRCTQLLLLMRESHRFFVEV